MNESLLSISKVLPVLFLILIGNLLARFRFFGPGTVGDLKKIVVNLALPALLFAAFAGTGFERKYLLIPVTVFAVCLLMLAAGNLIRTLVRPGNRYMPALFAGFETGMMGYSLFIAVYGAQEMFRLAVVDLGQVVFVFFVLVSWIERKNGTASDPVRLAFSFVKSPVIISIFAGLAAGATGLVKAAGANPFGSSALALVSLVSTLTVPLICLVIGYELRIGRESLGAPLLSAALRLAILTGLAFLVDTVLIRSVLGLDRLFSIALYTMFILPPPFVIPIFMKDASGKDDSFILNVISIHSVLSLAAFAVLVAVAG